jgi:hypothetical protein
MYCGKLIKDIWVFDPALAQEAKHAESFLILEGEPQEAAAFAGLLKIQPSNMASLVDWLQPGKEDEYVLLLSLDGKRGLIYPQMAVLEPDDKEVFWMPFDGHYHPYEVSRIIRDFKNAMRFETKLAEKIGYKIPPRPIKRRLNFDLIRQDFAPGAMDSEIREAIRNLESATDDALVWLAIAGPDNGDGLHAFDYKAVLNEIEMRQEKQSEFRSTFFPIHRISMEEILARQARARDLLWTFKDKFGGGEYGWDLQQSDAWVKRLDNDKLAELAVYTYYSNAGRMGEWKHFVGALQARFPGANRD